ncbi:MAG: sn-glycerol-3-phosphate ABC transporter ATP-binding protein UgpC [Spirochaetales bacterium]|nr:sn-glycerol-3-phosphate ABC transporter ATP-binding protein UgpC [Spirochaetales bacterium]
MGEMILSNMEKVYPGGVKAVDDFNMKIEDGEFIVFVGPSGCGKSTMLRMIAGLEGITGGDLILDGKRINDLAPSDRDIAMVFQNYALFGSLTVYENMGFPLSIKHVNGDDIYEKVMEATRVVELGPELNRKPNQLSGGQRQRVAIGRSLVRHPKVFLMDEPLSNLDAKLRAQTRKELAQLHEKLGTTFIYVTHDQVEAMTIADRIVVLNNGKIQQIGKPTEIYAKPANTFVGGFIGSPPMNFIDGKIENGKFVCEFMSMDVPAFQEEIKSSHEGRSVVLGIRPESFSLKPPGKGDLNATVEVVEYLGCEYVVLFSINGTTYRARLEQDFLDVKIGDTISFEMNKEKISFFDGESKQRIGK